MTITFTDIFCGAGGSSLGLTAAGMELRLAANHWQTAIDTHSANFPHADHKCADINNYDMRRLPRTDVLWGSPICTEVSPAGRRRRRRGQLDLLEVGGHVPADAFVRTRATFMDIIRATEVHRYKVVLVENVVEVERDWELFDWWVAGMRLLGYRVKFVSVSAAHIGGDDNDPAAQLRDRLYMVFVRNGIPMPDLDPHPAAWCSTCEQTVPAVQSWKRPDTRRIGKYGQQYVYRCPRTACRHALVEPYVRPAADIIDWSDLGSRLGDRPKLPVPATLRRIQQGLDMVTSLHADAGADRHGAFVGTLRKNTRPTRIDRPVATVAAAGRHHFLTVLPGAEVDPAKLVVPYRKGSVPYPAHTGPLSTIATREQHAVMHAGIDLADCRFRMLSPREHLRAQRFPDHYVVHGNGGEQTMQAGNAVASNVAQWLGRQVAAVL